MTDREQLIEKLEAATEGSRELDGEIIMEVCEDAIVAPWPTEDYALHVFHGDELLGANKAELPHYTTSIDAAITLIEKGSRWEIQQDRTASFASVDGVQSGRCSSSAIAICIASLKAQEHET